jgi:hypothetical protein
MPVSIAYNASILLHGCRTSWEVKASSIWKNGDDMFVKVSPINQSLVRLVADGVCKLPTSKKPLTLAGCPGFQQLLELRNEKHKADWLLTSTAGSSEGARKLFSAKPSKASPKKMQKRSAGALRELRQSPTVMLIRVPGVNGSPSLEVEVARPVHPCDVLAVRLEPTAIEHVLLFLRSSVTTDALTSAREYAQSGQKGVWQRKNSAFLVKLPVNGRHTKVAKTMQAAVALLDVATSDKESEEAPEEGKSEDAGVSDDSAEELLEAADVELLEAADDCLCEHE